MTHASTLLFETATVRTAMNEAMRRSEYFSLLWLEEKDKKKRDEYYKRVDFYDNVLIKLTQKFIKIVEEHYGQII